MRNPVINTSQVIGLIPARGGSKSIPLKNIVPIAGRPLIEFVISAGLRANSLSRIVCSTDHEAITEVCSARGVEVMPRPPHLAEDGTPVAAVALDVLRVLESREGRMPGAIALLQPTSPFVLPSHIEACVEALMRDSALDSAQTITPVIHNCHAYNQRVVRDGLVEFRFPQERREAFNKQRKPKHYLFGNLVVTRSRALLEGKDFFGDLSAAVEIPRPYAVDVDTAEDVAFATFLLRNNSVILDAP